MSDFACCVRMIPNTPKGHAAIALLRGKGIRTRTRGRGHRYMGGTPKGFKARPFDQDLPLDLATHYSLYMENPRTHFFTVKRTQCDYIQTEPSGKIRVRLEP